MLLQLDGTFIVIAISFILFALIMNQIFYKPVSKIAQDREEYIDSNIENSKAARSKSVELLKDYEKTIAEAKKQAGTIVNSHTAEATAQKTEAVQSAVEKANEKVAQAKELITNETDEAKAGLKSEVVALAQLISSKVLGEERAISSVPHELIDRYFDAGR